MKLFQINTDKSKASSLTIHSYATLKNIDIIAILDPYNIKTINKTHSVMEFDGYNAFFKCSSFPVKSVIYAEKQLTVHILSESSKKHCVTTEKSFKIFVLGMKTTRGKQKKPLSRQIISLLENDKWH